MMRMPCAASPVNYGGGSFKEGGQSIDCRQRPVVHDPYRGGRHRLQSVEPEARIMADPNICGGQPCIRGTRVPVHVVLDYLAAGDTIDAILASFPQLSRDDVLAALAYAARLAREEIAPIPPAQ